MFPILSLPGDAGARLAHQLATWRDPDQPGGPAASAEMASASPDTTVGFTVDGGVALDLAQDVAKGAAQGLIGLVSDAGKGWVMIGDLLVHGGAHIDRIAAFDLRPWSYGSGSGQVAGMVGEMLSPAAAVRATQAGAAAARMAAPALADGMMHFMVRQGLMLPVVERITPSGVRLFENQLPQRLAQELAEAKAVGVKPMHVGDAGFEAMVNEGTVKFVVMESGELRFGPHTRHGVEISHAVLSGGKPVRVAGEAQVMGHPGLYIATDIQPRSGHFLNGSTDTQNAVNKALSNEFLRRAGLNVLE